MLFGRRQNHRHPLALKHGSRFDLAHIAQITCEAIEKLAALVAVDNIAAPELNRGFNFIALTQEFAGMTDFEIVVVVVGLRPESQFLNRDYVLLLFSLFFFLPLFKLKLPVIHYPADRRGCIRGHLNQIQITGLGNTKCFVPGYYDVFIIWLD